MTPGTPYGARRRAAAAIAGAARAVASLLATMLVSGCAGAGSAYDAARVTSVAGAEPVDAALALATFDSAWSRINDTYHDPEFGGLDWVAVRDELRPRAAGARTQGALRAVVSEMLARIGESHFVLIPGAAAGALVPEDRSAAGDPGDAGMELRLAGGALVVSRVRGGGPAELAGVRTGWVVESIDGVGTEAWLRAVDALPEEDQRELARWRLVARGMSLLQGDAADTLRLVLRDERDRAVRRPVVLAPVPGQPVRFGNLPTVYASLEHRRVPLDDGCAGVIRFTVWMTAIADPFADAMDDLAHCRGVVVDLRGNPGGVAGMIMGMSGHFLAEQRPLGIMRTRGSELRFVSIPRRSTRDGRPAAPYMGALAILVDGMSASTSEFFAVGLQAAGRARLFGETSAGQALPALMVRLPNGDVMMHAFADYTAPDGTRIEGRGAIPDEVVPLARADLLAGRDAPLDAALDWIRDAPLSAHP
jgi:carboxyl-terminal processing protease